MIPRLWCLCALTTHFVLQGDVAQILGGALGGPSAVNARTEILDNAFRSKHTGRATAASAPAFEKKRGRPSRELINLVGSQAIAPIVSGAQRIRGAGPGPGRVCVLGMRGNRQPLAGPKGLFGPVHLLLLHGCGARFEQVWRWFVLRACSVAHSGARAVPCADPGERLRWAPTPPPSNSYFGCVSLCTGRCQASCPCPCLPRRERQRQWRGTRVPAPSPLPPSHPPPRFSSTGCVHMHLTRSPSTLCTVWIAPHLFPRAQHAHTRTCGNRAYKEFTSSARRDGVKFSHWVQANAEFVDYPFARFNKKVCRGHAPGCWCRGLRRAVRMLLVWDGAAQRQQEQE